jgi:hypothetical protein
MGKRSRKRSAQPKPAARRAKPRAEPKPADAEPRPTRANGAPPPDRGARGGYARSRAKDDDARAALVPLAEGERPRAVTVAAAVAALFSGGNLIAYAAGLEINGERPQAVGVISYSLLMAIAAWGMWRSKYWAVLGMQAILGILIVLFSLFLFEASDVQSALICVAIIVPAGTLFFFLIKAMARIQMPERRPSQ